MRSESSPPPSGAVTAEGTGAAAAGVGMVVLGTATG